MGEAKAGEQVSQQAYPLVEQLRNEQRERWQQGDRVSAEAYLAAYPALQSDAQGVLDLVLHEVNLRAERGETLQLDDFVVRFPQFREQLRQHIDSLVNRSPGTPLPSYQLRATLDSDAPPVPIFQSLRAAPSTPVPTLPGYEILGVLGRGGMGIVYKAQQVRLKRLVAIKMILSGAHAGSEALERFRLEAEAVARLQHPHIVQIYEIGEHEGMPYFTLEFVDGTTLEKKLAGQRQPAGAAAALVETLARAIHVAHQHQIVHRDLKPANVLVTSAGVPKITDFGLAKRLEGEGLTVSDAIMGTPRYMAPEQAWGRIKEIGPCTDVHALGAILYEMLTGRPPFEAGTLMETLELVRNQEPVPLRRRQPQVPRDLETICLKCLDKEIGQRYASAEALADDLRRFLDHKPIEARPTGLPTRLAKWVRRRPLVAALAGLLLLTASLGPAVGIPLWHKARKDAEGRMIAERDLEAMKQAERDQELQESKHYAAVTNGRGIMEGAGPVLHPEQVQRRQLTYKITTRGGQFQQIEVVNGRGQLTAQHPIGAFFDDLFDRPPRNKRDCRYESHRDDKGQVIKEIGYDRTGQVVYEFHYDREGKLGHMVDAEGFPLARLGTGAAYVRFVMTENNLQKELLYVDKNRKPRAGRDGTYGIRASYNEQGLPVELMLLDAEGQPTENRHGFSKMTQVFDDRANLIGKAFYGLDGRLHAHRDGYGKIQLTYDDVGNHIETACFGLDGQPCLHRERFARKTMLYDEYGNCVEEAYWGLDGQPITQAQGYARMLSRYDDRGNEIEATYVGLDGQPVRHVEGYAKVARRWDEHGNPIEETYLGPGGELVPHRHGYAKFTRSFDAHGNLTEGTYFALDGQPILHAENGYAKKTLCYDAQENLIEEAFFGTDGRPLLHKDGYAKAMTNYDDRGNSLEKRFFGLDGQLALHRDGYARITWAFDGDGNWTEEAFWDPDGKPVRLRDRVAAYARAVWTYDRRNQRGNVTYFDERGRTLPVAVGVRGVLPGGDGDRLGLMPGDILYKYAEKVIPNTYRLRQQVQTESAAQDTKPLAVIRNNKGIVLRVSPGWLHGLNLVNIVPAPWYKPQ